MCKSLFTIIVIVSFTPSATTAFPLEGSVSLYSKSIGNLRVANIVGQKAKSCVIWLDMCKSKCKIKYSIVAVTPAIISYSIVCPFIIPIACWIAGPLGGGIKPAINERNSKMSKLNHNHSSLPWACKHWVLGLYESSVTT